MEAFLRMNYRKTTGSFYSPSNLSLYVASKMASLLPEKKQISILDPAVGDGALLFAFKSLVDSKQTIFAGVDINYDAVENTSLRMKYERLCSYMFYTDALSPYNLDIKSGWNQIKKRLKIEAFDAIISNPPWGAEFDHSDASTSKLTTAVGQYDIYDLFLELSIDLLSDGGVYGFIVPDSIYRKEHYAIRKKLLTETSIRYITRIGEFIFESVNTSVSVIIGIKQKPLKDNSISCVHLPNTIAKKIASNELSFNDAETPFIHQCSQHFFIESNFSLSIDITHTDIDIINHFNSLPRIGDYLISHRGVELSKKGKIIQCPLCKKWMPQPKGNIQEVVCKHCGYKGNLQSFATDTIITRDRLTSQRGYPFLSGEDLDRYFYRSKSQILFNYQGINYKSLSLYTQPKILVRKTGVGITAVLDYDNNVVNQVVYMLTLRNRSFRVPLEFFIAVINSRITTFYIIKKFGSANWCTHPYLSQAMVDELPVPNFNDFSESDWHKVRDICNYVKTIYQVGGIADGIDVLIEKELLQLFKLKRESFFDILRAIETVEQLVPFKRLLKVSEKAWATVI